MKEISGGIFKDVRGVAFETWQMAVEPLPIWIHPPEGRSFRPWCATCFSLDRGDARSIFPLRSNDAEGVVLERALRLSAQKWRARPARIQVADPGLAPVLEELLAGEGIPVEVCGNLPGVRAAQATFVQDLEAEDRPAPGLLTGNGVTLAQIEAFAEAAASFFEAVSWRLLSGGDFVRIEAPEEIEPALRHVVVMRLREGISLSFFRDEAAREAFRDGELLDEQWVLFLLPLWDVPLSDADLWQRYGLPLCGEEELCPSPVLVRRGLALRPDARHLAFFEGLLRALAASTESEVDTGRWGREVATHLGRLRFVFSLPDLLDLAASEEPPRRSALVLERVVERRRKLLAERFGISEEEMVALIESYQPAAGDPDAMEGDDPVDLLLDAAGILGGRRAVLLARRALEIRPDCSEAYLVLADSAPDPARALALYDRARELAERELDPETGELEPETEEPEMDDVLRAREGMAQALCALGRPDEGVMHLREMLRLDPEDFLGVWDRLACTLLEIGRDAEVMDLLASSPEEGSTGWVYTRALLVFRKEGDSPASRRAVRDALRVNSLVPGSLLPRLRLSPTESRVFEDEEIEALAYAELASDVWRGTPGALTWLAEHLGARSSVQIAPKPRRGRKKPKESRRSEHGRKKKRRR